MNPEMTEDLPHPFAYASKDEFFALPPEEQVPHIWECLQYIEWRRGIGDVAEEEIDKQVAIMRHVAQDVAKAVARKLMEDGAYKDGFDLRWPRFNKGSKDPWYLTGCYPPQGLCVPDTDEAWDNLPDSMGLIHVEMAEWMFTPAGMHVFTDADREDAKRRADEVAKSREARLQAYAELKKANAVLEKSKRELERALKGLDPTPDGWKPYGHG